MTGIEELDPFPRTARLQRRKIVDLMAQHEIPSGPETAEEIRQEIEDMRRFARDT